MIGLCDCDSFFASCERVFRPDLKDKPIIVLSNNDGIIVASDKNAKALGFKRGMAWHEVEKEAKKQEIYAFSSNYTLYQDLSNRVMKTLAKYTPEINQYSIDEAFFTPSSLYPSSFLSSQILKETGIPVSIGIGKTKTLCKIATRFAKNRKDFSFTITDDNVDDVLAATKIKDVWGIGRNWNKSLELKGVKSAKDLRDLDISYVEKNYSVTLGRTVLELRGINAYQEEGHDRISLRSGISFKTPVTDINTLITNLVVQAETLSNKLAENGLLASTFGINFFSSRFQDDYISPYLTYHLSQPTNYAPTFSSIINNMVPRLFKLNYKYKGCRVFAFDLTREKDRVLDLFNDNEKLKKQEALTHIISDISKKYGKSSIKIARTNGLSKSDLIKRDLKSKNYTTQFNELPEIQD